MRLEAFERRVCRQMLCGCVLRAPLQPGGEAQGTGCHSCGACGMLLHAAFPLFSTFHCSPLSPLQVLPKMGVTVSVIDPADINSLEAALEQHSVR